jgi:hypothetical protein
MGRRAHASALEIVAAKIWLQNTNLAVHPVPAPRRITVLSHLVQCPRTRLDAGEEARAHTDKPKVLGGPWPKGLNRCCKGGVGTSGTSRVM